MIKMLGVIKNIIYCGGGGGGGQKLISLFFDWTIINLDKD
jgi:hypothetical protein